MVAFLLIMTMLLWGAAPIFDKMGVTKVDPLIGVTIRSVIVTVGLLVLILILNKGKELTDVDGTALAVLGASGVMAGLLGMWTYYSALRIGATSKIVPISACYPLVTTLLSTFVLGEALTVHRIIGTMLIILGIWLVK